LKVKGIISQGRDGSLYITSEMGGHIGGGAVFKITPQGKLTEIHAFTDEPSGGLTLGSDGYFYGITQYFSGIVFRVGENKFEILHSFDWGGTGGSKPMAPPIQGLDGKLYGTTEDAGQGGQGIVYKLDAAGQFEVLASFDGTQGGHPIAPLTQGADGTLYGTVYASGLCGLCGAVFKLTPGGMMTTLHLFDETHGSWPSGPVLQGSDGNLYGTALRPGIVFKVSPSGVYRILHIFRGNEGLVPKGGVIQAIDGNFYGTAGEDGWPGTIFRITPAGDFVVLGSLPANMGQNPLTLFQHTSGLFYGFTERGGSYDGGVFFSFDAGLPAFVRLLPAANRVGGMAEFLGQGFTGTTNVSFNGVPASFTVKTDTYLTAAVPVGAETGFVTVTTPSGTLQSNVKFRVMPQILDFTPSSGPVGTQLVITGVSLAQATKVTFAGVKATAFNVDSDNEVTATIPEGAKTGKISITTPGGLVHSAGEFTVTP
jgi:uncharacterized repeat protein (TIGR03803 family)